MENENTSIKRKKLPPSQSMATLENINDFSDDILSHILAFLPFKEAFRTIVLSKRWVPICHSLTIPNIDDEDLNNSSALIHFSQMLNTIMFSPHAQHLTLKSFHLKCHSKLWESTNCFSFNEWVEAAKRRGVDDLYLNLLDIVPLKPTIFRCETLVVLKLKNLRVTNTFRSSIHLPLLKTLTLCFVCFAHMNDLMKLLSGCLELENLKTKYVEVTTATGLMTRGFFKPSFKLINAKIHLFDIPFRAVDNVKFLTVFEMGRCFHIEEVNSYYKGFPVFENLIHLQLVWFYDAKYDWDEIVKMLQNCPELQTLYISKWTKFSKTNKNWKYPYHVPQCVSSHLTTCRIIHYQALEADFRFAKYILQNAKLLQVMEILHSSYSYPVESPQFLQDLSSCPRISPTCKLSLI